MLFADTAFDEIAFERRQMCTEKSPVTCDIIAMSPYPRAVDVELSRQVRIRFAIMRWARRRAQSFALAIESTNGFEYLIDRHG